MDQKVDTLIREQCYIDGAWTGQPKDAVTNPATGEIIAHVPDVGAEGARAAIEAAHRAFGPWKSMLAKERSAVLRRWYDLIMENSEALARLMTAEQGKPLAETRGEGGRELAGDHGQREIPGRDRADDPDRLLQHDDPAARAMCGDHLAGDALGFLGVIFDEGGAIAHLAARLG